MFSDNDAVRRPARTQLGQLVSADDSLAPLLVRDMISDAYPPESRYRYQVGVAVALGGANAPDGWSADLASRDILVKLKQTNKDPTLAANLASALNNMRGYVFYEVGGDGWLTKNGQLRPVNQKKPPLPPFASLGPKTILQADSAVNMRAGPSGGADVLDTLSQGDCVRVVSAGKADGAGGWLQAVPTKC